MNRDGIVRDLKLKPNFEKTIDRFEAWWHGDVLDRPPIMAGVPAVRPVEPTPARHATGRERWMDAQWNVERSVAHLCAHDFPLDNMPVYYANLGPEITATLYGCELDFSPDTSWSSPIIHNVEEWESVLTRKPNFDNIYWRTLERMMDLALERCDGRYIVALPDLHGNYDILAALRDPEALCVDLLDAPELVGRVGRHVIRGYIESFERCYAKVARAGMGSSTWCTFYHEGPAYIPSCDFWCMVSGEIAKEMIWPDIAAEMAPLKRSIFHLDGPTALRHLDLVLALPGLNALQWVYGAGNGPASKWIDVYRKALQAGKSVQLVSESHEDALAVLEAVGPRGLWICTSGFADSASAEAFGAEVERLSRGRRTAPMGGVRV